MTPDLGTHPDETEFNDPTYAPHSRIAGLERLQSPALKSKILPWLGAVRDGGESESAVSELSVGRPQSILKLDRNGRSFSSCHSVLNPAPADVLPLRDSLAGPARSVRSAPVLSPIRPLPTASLPSEHAASSPPPLPVGTLGSPIRFPSVPRSPGHRRHISSSTGVNEDRAVHGEGTVVSEGSPLPPGIGYGMTPPSGTIPSIFAVLVRPSSPGRACSSR